jgi:hypothetical protein
MGDTAGEIVDPITEPKEKSLPKESKKIVEYSSRQLSSIE